MTKAIFVGLSTIDLVYEIDQFAGPNSKITAKSQTIYIGGPATNAAITFAHLGGEPTLVTGVGQHPMAALIRDEMQEFSVNLVDLVPEFCDLPAVSSVTVNRLGQRNVVSANAATIAGPSKEVCPELLASSSIQLVDGHYMQSCQAWARAAHEARITVVLDGGSWKAGTEELLQFVDTAVCSADFKPPGCSDDGQVIEFLKSAGVQRIAITAGSAPIRFSSETGKGNVHVPEVPVVDTTGAGDILHGAYCYYATQGVGFAEALGQAAEIASKSCQYRGTRAWMHSE